MQDAVWPRKLTIAAHKGAEAILQRILNDLYASELNASISWIWDGGFHVTLGDPRVTEGWAFSTIGEAVAWLRDQACASYPDSEFARKYGGFV
jgi:hypothetical protein